ncbi:Uncharacterised protein [Mycobacterium tuberculosis]|nr:Uncharacterised protein [Mycobacterium tuberculosis]
MSLESPTTLRIATVIADSPSSFGGPSVTSLLNTPVLAASVVVMFSMLNRMPSMVSWLAARSLSTPPRVR